MLLAKTPKMRKIAVTITLEEDAADWVRREAARLGASVSCFLTEVLMERMSAQKAYACAMQRALRRKPFLHSKGRYLTCNQSHDHTR